MQQQLTEVQQKLQETMQELANERSERDQKISDVMIILNHLITVNLMLFYLNPLLGCLLTDII